MERKQELEWPEAQKIAVSEDLVAAAKQQLRSLAEVCRHRQLVDGPALQRAIYRVLEHDDTDSDRTEGKKLDVGFSGTTKQWEETFGSRYWKAAAMHRGNASSPLAINSSELNTSSKKIVTSNEYESMILPKKKLVEVMVEIVSVRDLPDGHRGSLFVTLIKKQPDEFFNFKRRLSLLSEAGEKQVAVFQCEPTGDIL